MPPCRLPWEQASTATFDQDTWELYDISGDFSQAVDLAASNPDKLRQLQDLFVAEAAKYNVLPLDDRFAERADARLRPSYLRGKARFVYPAGTVRIPEPSAPNTKNVHHTIAAEIDIPEGGADGVLVCCGGKSAGWTLFVHEGRLHWEHNWFAEAHYRVSSDEPLPAGRHIVSAAIVVDEENRQGVGGSVTLRVGEREVGEGRFDKQVPYRYTVNETLDVGCDTVSPVSPLYASPFAFTGTIVQAMIDVSEASFEELATEIKARLAMASQ